MKKGFSLIELLVVITIIGIIAAIAVPVYRNYSASSKVMQSFKVLESLMNRSIVYGSQHGTFGDAYNFGLSAGIFSRSAVTLSNYAMMPNILESSYSNFLIFDGSSCGQWGAVMVNLDPVKLGLSPANLITYNNTFFTIACYYWNDDGTINKYCGYSYGRGGSPQTVPGDLVPGLQNFNTGTNNDQINLDANVFNADSFINATCQ